jgi:ubiquinone biosynthesis protein COQ9
MREAMQERRALKDRILEAAFVHAAFDGWTQRTLLAAAADAGTDATTARRLFPQGGDSLTAWIGEWADRRMLEAVPEELLASMTTRQRVAALVRARLEALGTHREAMRRALLAQAMPQNAPGGWASLWRTVDRIWAAAGYPIESERGLARYTRRMGLAGVLVSTTLFWFEDRSPGFTASWDFLDRRIDDVMRFGRMTGEGRRLFDRLRPFSSLRRPPTPPPAGYAAPPPEYTAPSPDYTAPAADYIPPP